MSLGRCRKTVKESGKNWRKSVARWRHQVETFSVLLALCAGNSPVIDEFPSQRPVTRSFDVSLICALNKRLGKQSGGWWFETPSRSLWRHCNVPNKSLWGLRLHTILQFRISHLNHKFWGIYQYGRRLCMAEAIVLRRHDTAWGTGKVGGILQKYFFSPTFKLDGNSYCCHSITDHQISTNWRAMKLMWRHRKCMILSY